ncbi:glycosyltransferase [Ottowia thiooxydans]|uniref:Glycosyltransferase involved in cell wall biosynthesis n=1 Tax=Ottowia thiooxydans TaxID=219182 RepID=A0ABV2QBU7_9BURK
MRIVIDMQGAQSAGSRNRGIGRYSLSLAKAMARYRGEHEIILALNGAFGDSIAAIRSEFQSLLPSDCFTVWHPAGPSGHADSANDWSRITSEILRETFIARLKPDMVLITSLFEGYGDDTVTSVRTAQEVPTAVILYDLIPFIHHERYLENPLAKRWYENKLEHLRRADLQLAISESSRKESIEYLGTQAAVVINVSTAADSHFYPMVIQPELEMNLRARYGLNQPFVLYTGGIDYRKNTEGLIRAYAALPASLRRNHQLVIACSIQLADQERLQALAKAHGLMPAELILTDFVPEEDLVSLYNLCKAFVFPSWHEGFGLPALEAMACGRAVIGSNCTSIPEVIGCSDALFDPHDDQSITTKLERVLLDEPFRIKLQAHSLRQAAEFSWEKSAKLTLSAIETYHLEKNYSEKAREVPGTRPLLAYVSPLPPERSGIAEYSAELLPELAKYYEIEIILSQKELGPSWIREKFQRRTVKWFRENYSCYDRVIYHFGNSSFHTHMFELLQQVPGTVVLHDFFLSGVLAHEEWTGVKPGSWIEALYASHGYAAVQERLSASTPEEVIWKYPCNHAVLQDAQGIIIHSETSRALARSWYGAEAGSDWECIPLLRQPVSSDKARSDRARADLGLRQDQFVVCSFGLLNAAKLNHRLLTAWLNSELAADKNCILVFVGENAKGKYADSIVRAIEDSQCAGRIRITGWTDIECFKSYLLAADVGVQLRTLSRGETSAAVLDCMNYGVATIVNAHGSMADLPPDGVWMMPDEFSDQQLTEALTTLYQDKNRRLNLGVRAHNIIRTKHDPEACAARYAEAIEKFQDTSRTSVPALVSYIAQMQMSAPGEERLYQAAQAIDRTLSPPLKRPQILLDISALAGFEREGDLNNFTIEAVINCLSMQSMNYRIEPIYFCRNADFNYRYARKFIMKKIAFTENILQDDSISFGCNDIYIGFEELKTINKVDGSLEEMRASGVKIICLNEELNLRVIENIIESEKN